MLHTSTAPNKPWGKEKGFLVLDICWDPHCNYLSCQPGQVRVKKQQMKTFISHPKKEKTAPAFPRVLLTPRSPLLHDLASPQSTATPTSSQSLQISKQHKSPVGTERHGSEGLRAFLSLSFSTCLEGKAIQIRCLSKSAVRVQDKENLVKNTY